MPPLGFSRHARVDEHQMFYRSTSGLKLVCHFHCDQATGAERR